MIEICFLPREGKVKGFLCNLILIGEERKKKLYFTLKIYGIQEKILYGIRFSCKDM